MKLFTAKITPIPTGIWLGTDLVQLEGKQPNDPRKCKGGVPQKGSLSNTVHGVVVDV
jgi:hypothetical protein